jgi:hypothetical protein
MNHITIMKFTLNKKLSYIDLLQFGVTTFLLHVHFSFQVRSHGLLECILGPQATAVIKVSIPYK